MESRAGRSYAAAMMIGGLLVASSFATGYLAGRSGGASFPPSTTTAPSAAIADSHCEWGGFPYYPGSLAVQSVRPRAAWHVNSPSDTVAECYRNGASQLGWTIFLVGRDQKGWTFRVSASTACTGIGHVWPDPAGGTLIDAGPG